MGQDTACTAIQRANAREHIHIFALDRCTAGGPACSGIRAGLLIRDASDRAVNTTDRGHVGMLRGRCDAGAYSTTSQEGSFTQNHGPLAFCHTACCQTLATVEGANNQMNSHGTRLHLSSRPYQDVDACNIHECRVQSGPWSPLLVLGCNTSVPTSNSLLQDSQPLAQAKTSSRWVSVD